MDFLIFGKFWCRTLGSAGHSVVKYVRDLVLENSPFKY